MSLTLFGYWRSSASWRVRIALELKGLAYDQAPVHLVRDGGEQLQAAHRARNPLGQVPVLQVDADTFLAQSLAILTWLEATHPEPPLLPSDPVARARAWELAEVVNAGIQPLQNIRWLKRLEALGVDKVAWARQAIAEGFEALEARAAATAGDFLVGDAVSIADVCLVPQVYNARRFDLDLTPYPTLVRIEAACALLEPFRRAHPDVQPDAPAS